MTDLGLRMAWDDLEQYYLAKGALLGFFIIPTGSIWNPRNVMYLVLLYFFSFISA